MGFSLGGAAAACVSAAAGFFGGGDAGAPAADLGGGKVSSTFASYSSPVADAGVEVSAPKSGPSGPSI